METVYQLVPAAWLGDFGPAHDVTTVVGLREAVEAATGLADSLGDRIFIFAQGLPWKFPVQIVEPEG